MEKYLVKLAALQQLQPQTQLQQPQPKQLQPQQLQPQQPQPQPQPQPQQPPPQPPPQPQQPQPPPQPQPQPQPQPRFVSMVSRPHFDTHSSLQRVNDTENNDRAEKRRKIEDEVQKNRIAADQFVNVANQKEKELPSSVPNVVRQADGSVFVDAWVPNEIRKCVIYAEDCESGEIPNTTNELCVWDLQPFTGTPFPIPVQYDAKTRKIFVLGYACSVSCALSYVGEQTQDSKYIDKVRHVGQLAMDYYGSTYSENLMRKAPPRQKLSMLYAKKVQAGVSDPMTAALWEFRNGSEKLIYKPFPAPPFVRVTQRIDEEIVRNQKEEQHKKRLLLMTQNPKPIACTARGMAEQRKYVLDGRSGGSGGAVKRQVGAIETILGLQYTKNVKPEFRNASDNEDGDDDDGDE